MKRILYISLIVFIACSSDYTPKPRGYFKLDLPEKEYQEYNNSSCPFYFLYPIYSNINIYK